MYARLSLGISSGQPHISPLESLLHLCARGLLVRVLLGGNCVHERDQRGQLCKCTPDRWNRALALVCVRECVRVIYMIMCFLCGHLTIRQLCKRIAYLIRPAIHKTVWIVHFPFGDSCGWEVPADDLRSGRL